MRGWHHRRLPCLGRQDAAFLGRSCHFIGGHFNQVILTPVHCLGGERGGLELKGSLNN